MRPIPERRGDYDAGRLHDSLILRLGAERVALFLNEVGTIGVSVTMPGGSALCYSIEPDELIAALRLQQLCTTARAKHYEECAAIAESVGRPVGCGDGDTYVPGTSADAARAIRSASKKGQSNG